MKRILSFGAVLALLLVLFPAFGQDGAGSVAGAVNLFPVPPPSEEPDRLIFSHQKHVTEIEIACQDCHPGAAEATNIQQTDTPPMAKCGDCHDISENCGMCHTNAASPSAEGKSWVTEAIFSHKSHVAREGVDCKSCHPGAWESTDAADRMTPKMATCNTCHMPDMDRLACGKCHTDLAQLREAPTDVAVHNKGFFPLHGSWSRGSSALCAQCHEQRFCADCHERTSPVKPSITYPEQVERKFMHRGNFIERHALESEAQPARCLSCHGASYCQECHERSFAQPGEDLTGRLRRSPHPPGYVTSGGGAFHGRDARLNAQQCAGCHDQGAASNCVTCHQVGGPGGNPHPRGWEQSGRGGEDPQRNGTCLVCHR